MSDKDKEGMTAESIEAAEKNLEDQKTIARQFVESAKNLEELNKICMPDVEKAKALLKSEAEEKLNKAKDEKKKIIEEISLSSKDKEGMTVESIEAAEKNLREQKDIAISKVDKAETISAVEAVELPDIEKAKALLKDKASEERARHTTGNQYTEGDLSKLYNTEKAALSGIKIVDENNAAITAPVSFKVWNGTLQRFEGEVKSENGTLPDVKLIKGHRYIFFSNDKDYDFTAPHYNAYVMFPENGDKAVDFKS